MESTLDTSHSAMSPLKCVDRPENNKSMFLRRDTFHSPIGPYKLCIEQSVDTSRHASTAALSSLLASGENAANLPREYTNEVREEG